jgi:diguanylate cyclase (GGDEF)-like protein
LGDSYRKDYSFLVIFFGKETNMEIRLYFQMLRRGWWIVILTTLIAITTGLAMSYTATPQYQSTAKFIITPSSALVTRSDVLSSLDTLDRQSVMATYAEVMNSNRIHDDTQAFLQLQPDLFQKYSYQAVVVSTSSVIELTVSGPDPQTAAKIANALGNQTINFTRQLNQVYNVDFLDIAGPAGAPFSPRPLINAILAGALGLILGAALAIFSEQLRIPLDSFRQRLHLDGLTGVFNSAYFARLIDDERRKNAGNVFSICVIELSGLRDLIETLPIASLQRILKSVTEILRRELRGNDIIGRWNDISFIILLPSTSGEAAKAIFDRIYQIFPRSFDQFDSIIDLDAHVGGAEFSNDVSTQELIDKANMALEAARGVRHEPVYVWK